MNCNRKFLRVVLFQFVSLFTASPCLQTLCLVYKLGVGLGLVCVKSSLKFCFLRCGMNIEYVCGVDSYNWIESPPKVPPGYSLSPKDRNSWLKVSTWEKSTMIILWAKNSAMLVRLLTMFVVHYFKSGVLVIPLYDGGAISFRIEVNRNNGFR